MPGYKGHLLGGSAAFGLIYLAVSTAQPVGDPVQGAIWYVCTLAGALFPDIDTKSKGQKYFYWIVLGLMLYFFYKGQLLMLSYLALASITPMLVKHRGIFHNMWFIVGIIIGMHFLATKYAPTYAASVALYLIFFAAGALSHLYLDLGFRRMVRLR